MTGHRLSRRSRFHQHGLSFFGLVFVGVFAVAVFAIGGQSVPIFLENQAIRKAAAKAAREGSTVPEVRSIFDKATQIDDIKSLKGSDLEVSKRNDKIVVSYQYSREIALAGPAFLVYRFNEQTH